MPSIDFEVWCEDCGAGLCDKTDVNGVTVTVEPCETCLKAAKEEGYEEGHETGHEEGVAVGRTEGYDEGHADAEAEAESGSSGSSGEENATP